MKVLLVTVGLAALPTPALAANQFVQALGATSDEYGSSDNRFAPRSVTVAPGESVSWTNGGPGYHNVKFEDGLFTAPATPLLSQDWPATPPKRTFPTAGTFRYYCELHGSTGGGGMSGVVTVASPTGSQPGAPGSGAPGAGTPGADAKILSLSLAARRFCTRKGPRCRRPGVRLKINLSKSAAVRGTLKRRPLTGGGRSRRYGTLNFGTVGAGSRVLRFTRTQAERRLRAGRYTLTLRAGQDQGVLRFRVTP